MRLCVVSLNPAIDAEWRVEDVLWEEKNSVHAQRRWPGGKGVNVARWLRFFGAKSEILIPLGGATGDEMISGMRVQGLCARVIRLAGATRVNVVVTTAAGRQMRFNPPGPRLSTEEWRRLLATAQKVLQRDSALILSGALPRGLPASTYARLIRLAHQSGQLSFLDCDGPALVMGAKAKPFLVKPNLHELSLWAKTSLRHDRSTLAAARKLSDHTRGWVLVSLGERGALLVNTAQAFAARGTLPRLRVLNTVGAGDALLAAAAHAVAGGCRPEEWLRAGVGAGTAATQSAAGCLPPAALVRRFQQRVAVKYLA